MMCVAARAHELTEAMASQLDAEAQRRAKQQRVQQSRRRGKRKGGKLNVGWGRKGATWTAPRRAKFARQSSAMRARRSASSGK